MSYTVKVGKEFGPLSQRAETLISEISQILNERPWKRQRSLLEMQGIVPQLNPLARGLRQALEPLRNPTVPFSLPPKLLGEAGEERSLYMALWFYADQSMRTENGQYSAKGSYAFVALEESLQPEDTTKIPIQILNCASDAAGWEAILRLSNFRKQFPAGTNLRNPFKIVFQFYGLGAIDVCLRKTDGQERIFVHLPLLDEGRLACWREGEIKIGFGHPPDQNCSERELILSS